MYDQDSETTVKSLLDRTIHDAALNLTYTLRVQDTPQAPRLLVCFDGPDVPALLFHNAELLLALEHLATQVLHLEPNQHDQISFDAGNFKAIRARQIERSAREAVRSVQATGRAFHFPPMSSRERRLLHLALTHCGLTAASEGDPPRRHLVLHPPRVTGKSC